MVRWVAAAGAFVVSLDSMVNIAFPAIAAAFGAPPERMRWIIICYTGSYAVRSFVAGAAADRIGPAPVFRVGLALSVAGFGPCGAAPSFPLLLAGRAVQGVAGGLVYGTAPALATLGAAASLRGRRLGFLNAAIGLGFASGPVLAGVLIDTLGWRAVFHARVPAALAALGWALAVRRGERREASQRLVAARDVLRATRARRAGSRSWRGRSASSRASRSSRRSSPSAGRSWASNRRSPRPSRSPPSRSPARRWPASRSAARGLILPGDEPPRRPE